ncbi:MAG: 23S rRNA (uracil(1939)-C(5))-methyltransferase RlmD [SAR202 cluster bacterium Io17-Chloro-G2]|nr:MAG: 23S rRNA (uracil(1939)-C(5))-methyltransferase RlmD [SAR202 cluster bacterium Io17-Chloro-G2]
MNQVALAPGDRVTLALESWGRLGEAMAQHQGWDVFVFGGIPGESVVAEVVRVHRRYAAAHTVEVLQASPDRVAPPCPYYGDCTGCQWQHLAYGRQLAVKRGLVVDALARVAGLENVSVTDTVASPDQYGYRNHARFTVRSKGSLGFVHRETRRFVRIDRCMLMHSGINEILTKLQDKSGDTTQLSVRAGKQTGDALIQPLIFHPELEMETGQKHYLDSVAGRRFKVSSPSFFQVNIEQASQLIQTVKEGLGLTGNENLLDAYTGVGAIAVLLAPYVKRVLAVEESTAAVADARENAAGLDNVEFLLGKTEDVLSRLMDSPDAVVLDPPRAGCQPAALESLVRLAPKRVAYVSCDPETLARDLKFLCQEAYVLDRVVPLDMFPQTHHVECIAFLELAANSARGKDSP